ncbi:MAG: S8 family serine peptidase [Actinobacteria bacterium]|nr:S8 family serine peptidase [Actinomycetota bacterium]
MRTFRILSLPLAVVAALALGPATLASAAAPAPGTSGAPAQGTIPGRYIVTLVDGADPAAVAREYRARGADVDHVYRSALRGFAGAVPAREVDRLRADARVERVEADGWVSATGTQSNATWGLDRVDQRDLPLDGSYSYATTASNVTAYVIDTGIRASHTDFGGRVSGGFSSIDDRHGTDDCNGHGTHVAGTIGGATYGVAKAVQLVPVRVLNCRGSGTWSGVIAGVDWVTDNAVKPAVANMSLGGGANDSVDTAVRNSIASGVVYALAAGNDSGSDACTRSPARVTEGLTVGATTKTDARASYSNIGTCLDLFAPGSSITSAWIDSDTDTHTISGTSMATPHVAGAAALSLAGNTAASVDTVNTAVVGNATAGVVTDAGADSPNLLLYSVWGASEPVAAPATPTGFTADGVSSSRIDLTWTDSSDETGYRITLHDGTTVDVAADTVMYPVDGLAASTEYTFGLQAIGSDGVTLSTKVEAKGTTLAASSEPVPVAPVASIATDCAGSSTCGFDGSGSTPADVTYLWSTGETTSAIMLTFSSPGSYTVALTVTDSAGATDDQSATVSCGWSGKGKNKVLVCS